MSAKRLKINLPIISTPDEAESVMNDLAAAVNNQRLISSELDDAILALKSRYELTLAECADSIKRNTDALRAWAESNPEQFPKDRKSLKMTSGTLGFRTGTPKLALLSRAWTWEKVLHAIIDRGFSFLRVKQEVDKEAIIAFAHAGPEPLAELQEKILKPIGVHVVHDESFFIEPDLTIFEPRQ